MGKVEDREKGGLIGGWRCRFGDSWREGRGGGEMED